MTSTNTKPQPLNDNIRENHERAADWFSALRDRIWKSLEDLEDEAAGAVTTFRFRGEEWARRNDDGTQGGGGTMGVLKGQVFEKAGVNISNVCGTFSEQFQKEIPGAEDRGGAFMAAGISLVIHPCNPYVPAIHMNTRHIVTSRSWFGGGIDLTPVFADERDEADFHSALQACCDRHDPDYYPRFKQWCEEYFYLPHRGETRGIGGIFYDYINTGDWEADFAFTRHVGETFLAIYPELVRRHMHRDWTDADKRAQKIKRGRYAEFNLLYDRGTQFGLKTGGKTEAILMSLPPEAVWE